MEIKIYQLTNEAFEYVDYAFSGWERAKNSFDMHDYECVYDYIQICKPSIENDYRVILTEKEKMKMLEDIFYRFNQERPEDFKGHSLSTSDVVALGDELYYCDSFGWVKIGE